ncbi:hypothetical protein [Paenibacillus sp. PL2-23]|uniref:hypothetical protein n=1 Tax=Paenibacillus sp. PL2-23 TaxID=2100729 RepID=UPI0030F844B7
MSKYKAYFAITCYSFTFLMLIYSALNLLGLFRPASAREVLLMFLITLCGSILIAVTDRLPIRNPMAAAFVRVADVSVCVFGIGFAAKMIPLNALYVLIIFAMIVAIYVIVSAFMMIKDKAEASAINEQLSRRYKQTGGNRDERYD